MNHNDGGQHYVDDFSYLGSNSNGTTTVRKRRARVKRKGLKPPVLFSQQYNATIANNNKPRNNNNNNRKGLFFVCQSVGLVLLVFLGVWICFLNTTTTTTIGTKESNNNALNVLSNRWVATKQHIDTAYNYSQQKLRAARSSATIRIPQTLIVSTLQYSSKNILETKEPKDVYDNVMHTIDAYQTAWNNDTTTNILWLKNNEDCRLEMSQADSRLLSVFNDEPQEETNKKKIEWMCRLAALYNHGGYLLDIHMVTIQPLLLDEDISLATVQTAKKKWQPLLLFLASQPNHPLVKQILEEVWNDKNHDAIETFFQRAFEKMSKDKQGTIRIYSEMPLDQVRSSGPSSKENRQEGVGDCCNIVICDPQRIEQEEEEEEEAVVYFYSQMVGIRSCCVPSVDNSHYHRQQQHRHHPDFESHLNEVANARKRAEEHLAEVQEAANSFLRVHNL